MTRWTAFALGVAVAAAAATLIARTSPSIPESSSVAFWQARAESAERELEAARARVSSLATQLERLTARFDALAARFDELARQAAPNATPDQADTTEPQAAPTPEFQPVSEEQWDALVSGALQSEIERRFGHSLPPERQQRLVDALARVRAAAALMQAEEPDSENTARSRQHLTRSVILLEADRVFREETGIGVAEFLRSLDAEQVEDVPPADAGNGQP